MHASCLLSRRVANREADSLTSGALYFCSVSLAICLVVTGVLLKESVVTLGTGDSALKQFVFLPQLKTIEWRGELWHGGHPEVE